jgi:pyruvate/2-oxoglutarate dehydrogenase complex dihydrolipoamide dehydrogenase (E3) component
VVVGAGPAGQSAAELATHVGRRVPLAEQHQPGGVVTTTGGAPAKTLFRADDRKLLGVHCIGDLASEVIGLGHVALHAGGAVELFLTLGLNTPTYSHAYHDAAVDGLTRLAELLGHDMGATSHRRAAAPAAVTAAAEGG